MLAIRMQRTGRKGHAMFRVVVQDSRRTPTSGRIVAQLGSYDPHAKASSIDTEKAGFYLQHGAQPSERVARILKGEGMTLPAWVSVPATKQRTIRHADKRRSTTPPAPVEEETPEPVTAADSAVDQSTPEVAADDSAVESVDTPAES